MSPEEQHAVPGETAEDEEISVLDLALVFAQNWKLLVLAPLAAGVLMLVYAFFIPLTFTATARILPPQQQQSSAAALAAQFGALAGLVGGGAGFKSPSDQYVALLKSRTINDAMIERFKLKELYRVEFTVDARRVLEGSTKISAGAKDGIISIDVDDRDPKRAADMANGFVEELRKLTNTIAVTEAAQRRLFFENQLKLAKDNLAKSEIALRSSGVSEATLRIVPQSTLEELARLKAQLTAQEIRLASMRTSMTEANADLRVALQELSALRAELAKAEQSSTSSGKGDGTEYIQKFRDFKYHETLFELMAKQYELARLDEARDGAVIQVVDAAQPPERKSKPKKAQLALLMTIFVFVGMVLFVYLRHALRSLQSDPASAEKLARLRSLFRWRRA